MSSTDGGKANDNYTTGDNDTAASIRHAYTSIEDVRTLVNKYIDQQLDGCGNKDCTEGLCHTGKVNTTKLPVRKCTPKTARMIAITICSGFKPERHLCQFYDNARGTPRVEAAGEDGEYDQSSLAQLLTETPALKQLESPAYPVALELQSLHQQLDGILESAYPTKIDQQIPSTADFSGALLTHLDWLVAKLPPGRAAIWEMLDRDIISQGHAYPQKLENRPNDDQYNTWLKILDVLDNEPYLRLLRRVISAVARRMAFEKLLLLNGNTRLQRRLIKVELSSRWCEREAQQPNTTLALVVWLKKLFAREWRAEATVQEGSVEHGILELLNCIKAKSALTSDLFEAPVILSRIHELELSKSLRISSEDCVRLVDYHWLFSRHQRFFCFRAANHLDMKYTKPQSYFGCFETDHCDREAHSASLKAVKLRERQQTCLNLDVDSIPAQAQHSEEHYLLLNVSRTNILKDTFDQLWQRRRSELRRPLRVRLGHTDEFEVGHDLGGVQIEFFNVVCREAFAQDSRKQFKCIISMGSLPADQDSEMFTTDPNTGVSYFRAGSLQPLHMFELFGVIVALAMYNGVALPIKLPLFFYWMLGSERISDVLNTPLEPSWVSEIWPTTGRSLQSILDEDIEGLEYAVPLEANGLRLAVLPLKLSERRQMTVASATAVQHHQDAGGHSSTTTTSDTSVDLTNIRNSWPGWTIVPSEDDPGEVTRENKTEYVDSYIKWLFYFSVAPQFQAFLKGFCCCNVLSPLKMAILDVEGLKYYIEGREHLDINVLRAVTGYDGYEEKSKYIQNFWRIVTGWTQEKQKLLLKFVTAAERIPITGGSSIVFIIKRAHVYNIEDLPTSSTCFGTLLLPRYASAEILAQKLDLALKYGTEGFGMG